MRKFSIEWKYFDKEGKTCGRCSAMGANLAETIKGLQNESDEICIGWHLAGRASAGH